jgi:putative transposase
MKRCDHHLLMDANPGKVEALREVLRAFRRAAPDVAADQWRRFFETARFNKMVSAEEEARSARLSRSKALVGAARMQMLRYQAVRQLESFIENRANDFRDAVMSSSIDGAMRHQLLAINAIHAWFRREPVVLRETGEEIPDGVRRLARRIMHGVLARHRRPRFHHLNPCIDQRQATFWPADKATHAPLWVGIRGMTLETGKNGRPKKTQVAIKVPLKSYAYFEARGGQIAKTVQLTERGADGGRPGETKAESLRLTVLRHLERDKTRGRVTSAKVLGSFYYRSFAAALEPPLIRKSPPPDVVADVSAG